jgi:hypothetical protein
VIVGRMQFTRIERPERGDFVLRIDHADPQIEITAELLDEIFHAEDHRPYASRPAWVDFQAMTCEHHNWCCPGAAGLCYKDGLLHFDGINQHVVYRIGDYVWERNTWLAAWPD